MNTRVKGNVLYKNIFSLMKKAPLINKLHTYRGHSHWLLGAMTIEASLCMPVFFLVVFSLFYVFNTIIGINKVQCQLSEASKNYASYNTKLSSIEMLLSDAKLLVWEEDKKLCHIEYREKIPLCSSLFSIRLYQQMRISDYKGKSMVAEEGTSEKDIYVYITENGRVYHKNYECSYLNPSVEGCLISNIGSRRNSSGAKYYPCETCCSGNASSGTVYITSYGSRYHTYKNCSNIKRNAKRVKLSDIGNMPPCSKCGG